MLANPFRQVLALIAVSFFKNVNVQGEFADLGQQGLLPRFKLLGQIEWMAAQGFGVLGKEVVLLLLDLSLGDRVLARGLRSRGLVLEHVDDQRGLHMAVQRCGLSA